ncbi:AAA family ATPase [Chitinophaga sp.]|uniref:AAA family ATPase n=1 Tax=Chitinophaga sp. TaxID=1869181 RepID=UPI0026273C6E|nr:ATP-binding protein [uncultured Chitinophaga sp.]
MNILDLIIHDREQVQLDSVFLDDDSRQMCRQLIREHQYIAELHQYGLPVNNKLLLHGASGCGKTMTAKALAHALHKNIYILNLSNIVSARIGETSQHLKQVFDKAARENAVLFLDEFDQIAKARGNDAQDVGEMRRLVNTLLQLIDYYPEKSLLICATNHPEIIDAALMRRFQVRIAFEVPADSVLDHYYDQLLARFPDDIRDMERRYGISFAEAKDYCFTTAKARLIRKWEKEQALAAELQEN